MKKSIVYAVFIGNLLIATWFWWQYSSVLFLTGQTESIMLGVSRLAGIVATQLALIQLMLIGRIKWVEEQFGLDKLSRVHKWNGYAVLSLVILHVFLVTKAYAGFGGTSYFAQSAELITKYDDVFKAFLAYLLLITTVLLSISIVRRKLKYEYWYYVHILNYLTFVLFVGHQLELGISAESLGFKIYWLATYSITALHILWFRFANPLLNLWKHDFTISKVENLGIATSIYIEGRSLESFKRESGQFFIFRFLQEGFWYEAHPFSLSWSASNSQLRITAKALGDFTGKLKDLKAGTKVLIDGPHGVFTAKQIKRNKVLMIAGGIGITPLRGLAEDITRKTDAVLLYSAKSKREAVLLDEIEDLSNRNGIRIVPIFSEEKVQNAEHGMLDEARLQRLVPDLTEREVFLCGPPPMMAAVRKQLSNLGLPKKQFHWERFAL